MEEHPELLMMTYYKVDVENEIDRKAVLYYDEGKLCHYDATSEELTTYPKSHVQKGIEMIFE